MAREKTSQSGGATIASALGRIVPAKKVLSVKEVLALSAKMLDLKVIAGEKGLENEITTGELNRPGLALAGFFDVFTYERIQILGNTELSFLNSLEAGERRQRLERVCSYRIPCIIVTSTISIPPELIEVAGRNEIPVLKTSLHTTPFVGLMISLLEQEFLPSITIHGVLMDVFGMGVVIVGESGVGKSECALELIHRGHRLVADDVVILQRHSKTTIVGRSSPLTKHFMEVRGLGIINIESLFGAGAVSDEKIIDLIVHLENWESGKEYERLGIEDRHCTIFDVQVAEYVIPVEPGRNLSVLIEVAAMNQRLKNTGFNPARSLDEQLIEHMKRKEVQSTKSKARKEK
jgi:HPr kinase/phosphorylase